MTPDGYCVALHDIHDYRVVPCPNKAMDGKDWCAEHLAEIIRHREELRA